MVEVMVATPNYRIERRVTDQVLRSDVSASGAHAER